MHRAILSSSQLIFLPDRPFELPFIFEFQPANSCVLARRKLGIRQAQNEKEVKPQVPRGSLCLAGSIVQKSESYPCRWVCFFCAGYAFGLVVEQQLAGNTIIFRAPPILFCLPILSRHTGPFCDRVDCQGFSRVHVHRHFSSRCPPRVHLFPDLLLCLSSGIKRAKGS